jgi:hypothetical protein
VLNSTLPILVHLVHGTWPFGLFGRRSDTTKAWFEDGSTVRANIQTLVGHPIQFQAFRWSGRNSLNERWKASIQFGEYLERAQHEWPNTRHVVIAHSHGGTVAARAIGLQRYRGDSPIKALICLSTPFTYLHSASESDERLFLGALAVIFTVPVVVALNSLWSTWWFLYAADVVGPLLFILAFSCLSHSPPLGYYFPAVIHPSIPTFVIRATRDEAALTIGFTQSVNALLRSVYKAFDEVPSIRRLSSWVPKIVSVATFAIVGLLALSRVVDYTGTRELNTWQGIPLLAIFASATGGGLLFICAYGLIALAVGFYDVRSWACSTIEVDAAPPEKQCSIKLYYDLDDTEGNSLRHGIYELASVQLDIASVIRAVAQGIEPILAPYEETEEMARHRKK